MTYTLIEPIEIGSKTITEINLHKPTFGELTKVKSADNYTQAMEMLAACSDQTKIELSRLSFDDTNRLMGVLVDFLGLEQQE